MNTGSKEAGQGTYECIASNRRGKFFTKIIDFGKILPQENSVPSFKNDVKSLIKKA